MDRRSFLLGSCAALIAPSLKAAPMLDVPAGGAVYSFTGQQLGAAAAARRHIYVVAPNVTSVSVAGQPLSRFDATTFVGSYIDKREA